MFNLLYEFNTADTRSMQKYFGGGSGNWTPNKFLYFLNNMNANKFY